MTTKSVKKGRQHHLTPPVKRWIGVMRDKYGLPNWPVFFKFVEGLKEEGMADDEYLAGDIEVFPSSCEVWIRLNSDLKREAVPRLVAHEMAHWLLNDLDSLILSLLPPEREDREKLKVFYKRSILEPAVERIALAVVGHPPAGAEPYQPVKDTRRKQCHT